MDEQEFFESLCFLPDWSEVENKALNKEYVPPKKDLTILLAELEDIKNDIEDIKAREWHLAKLMKFHKAGISTQ